MSKIMQNLVVLMEPSKDAHNNSLEGGNMVLNRFCIDEDAAFELSGVNYLKDTQVIQTSRHGLKTRILLRIWFDRSFYFFACVI